ncbi:MAG TPA: sigma-70 family RNA polymerase sigma factor [Candidatus Acidoferrales bacterium]|nr:sigma-70 family RNA polymerase sigma factor [Candidatus Acidoferrales bacterium]
MADHDAWVQFVRRFQPTIASVVIHSSRRWGEPSLPLIEDLVQETFLKLCDERCRLLREFTPRHGEAIFGFVKIVALRVVHDFFRRARTFKRGAGEPPSPIAMAEQGSIDTQAAERMEQQGIVDEIDRWLAGKKLGTFGQRDRRIFWLYYRWGFTARAIASLPGTRLATAGVESAILRLTRLVREEFAGDRHAGVDPERFDGGGRRRRETSRKGV